MAVTENIFLRGEYHSIIPFILISSKEVHRMVLSDYEIKEITHQFLKKSKRRKLDSFDYYRMGLIHFYKGSFVQAYLSFKTSHKLVTGPTGPTSTPSKVNLIMNISKWLAFSGLVLLFCPNKIIDFSNLKKLILYDESDLNEKDNRDYVLFSCCTVRKNSAHKKINNLQVGDDINENEKINFSNMSSPFYGMGKTFNQQFGNLNDSNFQKMDQTTLAAEIEDLIFKIKDNPQNSLEGWWLLMYIGLYCKFNKTQKIFKKYSDTPFEPKFCIKKIKEIDAYLSYIAFAEMNIVLTNVKINSENNYSHSQIFNNQLFNLNNSDSSPSNSNKSVDYKIDEILSELIFKFKNRIEAYLKYWQLLVKKDCKFKNYKKAHSLSEIFWRMSSSIKFDENDRSMYYFYIMITHAKSSYLIGNSIYTISFFQKEYTSNFLYPTIFYLVIKTYFQLIFCFFSQ
jgi:hypothetical protein